jgi:hypothetical protein
LYNIFRKAIKIKGYQKIRMIRGSGMRLHGGLDDNFVNAFPFTLDGTIYKRYCIDLRIKLAGYQNIEL